ncbi:MAG: biotin/lipoate--protein ligase family protein [Pseudolabrys sp.]|nr:biotin/lipoate--protein ligase family protein [Pseudolabrys sp.]MDP2297100.1 biotin/lipoate--protein ligase family protein [Pseudolabrys sp.]
MPLQTRAGARNPSGSELMLPPPFTAVRLRELGDAFAHAMAIAPEQGAGTLVYVGRFDLAEFAVVVEPDEPLAKARRVFYAGMVALADALSSYAQPDTAITFGWPDSVSVNQGLVGGARLGWPPGTGENDVPEWLVFGAMIRTVSMTEAEPGLNPLVTALEEEGFTDGLSNHVVESFARHFMVAIDSWQESGFGAVANNYLARLPVEKGLRRDIDVNGDLLLRRMGKADIERVALLPRLTEAAWRDPVTKGPRA